MHFPFLRVALALLVTTAVATADLDANSTYQNPILPGFHPDPSCISVEEYDWTFFCASSSFFVYPGVPIHASKDLVNWKLVSNAISRPTQLPDLATTVGLTSGIWAPTLRYNNGTFYISTTLVFDNKTQDDPSRWSNFVVKTQNPFESDSWSDPLFFDYTGYDTSLFWGADGTVYVTGAKSWQSSYPAITQKTIDLATGETGEAVDVWNGTGGLAPEGPHIYKRGDWYYLMIAEGGTGLNHEVDIARSRDINGPYAANVNPQNPILTQANTSSYFQTVGHADLFQDKSGNWWGVALSTRSGPEYVVYPMGRETVLTPVTWEEGGWPIFSNISGTMSGWPLPPEEVVMDGEGEIITAADHIDFAPGTNLPPHFVYWRTPIPGNYIISPPGHEYQLELDSSILNLTGLDGMSTGPGGQTFVSRRQVHTFFTFSVTLDYSALRNEGDEAGVSVFLLQLAHFDLGVVMLPTTADNSSNTSHVSPHLRFRGKSILPTQPAPEEIVQPINETWLGQPLTLEIKAFNYTHYSLAAGSAAHEHLMQTVGLAPAADVSALFTGTLLGAYCTTNGGNGSTKAWISDWTYEGQGQVRT